MVKFGLLKADESVDIIKTILMSNNELSLFENITQEDLEFNIDAIHINYSGNSKVELISNYLKNFKHVFLSNSYLLEFADFQKIVKISEESNVRFYTDFESPACFIKENISQSLKGDIQFIQIKHKISKTGLLGNTYFLKQQILCNIDIALSVSKANVKKVSAFIWPLFAKNYAAVQINLEFDNNSVANIMIFNDSNENSHHIEMFTKSENLSILTIENILNITVSDINSSQTAINKTVTESTCLKSNINSFLTSLDGVLPGIIDIDNKYNAIRICNVVCSKLMSFSTAIIF